MPWLGLGLVCLYLVIWLALFSISGSLQLLNSSHVRERDKALLRAIMVGGVWNCFLLSRVRGQAVPCRFCGAPDNDGHLFRDCPFPPLVEIRENPEFHDLMRLDKAHWPRCLLPVLSGVNGPSPWAVDASESAAYLVEVALGRYSSGLIADWVLSDEFDHDSAASSLPDHPDVWTEGSLVLDHLTGVSSSGSNLNISVVGGVMLMVFFLILSGRPVEVFVRFLGHFNLFRELRCGGLFWPCRPLVLFTLVLIILVLFGMLVGYLAVVVILSLLSLSMTVIFSC